MKTKTTEAVYPAVAFQTVCDKGVLQKEYIIL